MTDRTEKDRAENRGAETFRVAALDCGTNTMRLLIADLGPDRGDPTRPLLTEVHRELRTVRLGEGVDATGRLTTQAIDRAWSAMAHFAAVVRSSGVVDLRVVATSAIRDAVNADLFVEMVRSTLGREPEVLTGDQEAQLGFLGTVAALPPGGGDVLVVDIGGGSTEFVVGAPGPVGMAEVRGAISVDLGAVRITERLLTGDPPTPAQISAAEIWITDVVSRALGGLDLRRVQRVLTVAGTAMTVAAGALRHSALDEAALDGQRVPFAAVGRTADELLRATRAHRAMLRYVLPGRVDVIGGGALILRLITDQLAARTSLTELVVSRADILDGLALSLFRTFPA